MIEFTKSQSHSSNSICERCCYQLAVGDSIFTNEIPEFLHLFHQAMAVVAKDVVSFFGKSFKSNKTKSDHKHTTGTVCTFCAAENLRPPHPWLAVIVDYLDTLVQLIAFVAMLLGGFCAGVAVLMMSIFPSATHQQLPNPNDEYEARQDSAGGRG